MPTVGVGIDLGAVLTKGVALRVFEDGTATILEAAAVPTADLKARAIMMKALARHRPNFIMRPVLSVCTSHPEAYLSRVQIPLPSETGETTADEIRHLVLDGSVPAPAGINIKDDLWDVRIIRMFRRAADVEQHGKKFAEAVAVRVTKAAMDARSAPAKPLHAQSYEPAMLAVVNTCARFGSVSRGANDLIVDMGLRQFSAILLADGQPLRTATISLGDLAETVEKLGRLDSGKADQKIMSADMLATDPVNSAIRDAITKAFGQVAESLGLTGDSPSHRPGRGILCGGLSPLTGMAKLASPTLGCMAEILAQPDRLRSAAALPVAFPVLAGAIGAALRSAGVAPLKLAPQKQVAPRKRKATQAQPVWSGWKWIAVGAVALASIVPTAVLVRDESRALSSSRREMALLEPDSYELARQAKKIKEYASLTGTGALSLMPWGTVIMEMANRLPSGVSLSSVSANRDRLLVGGRVDGSLGTMMKKINDRLRQAPVMKQYGLTPPEF
jgi:hypothetical protein